MTTTILQLWAEGLAPGWDGLFRADGSARAVELGGGARRDWFDLGPPLDLDAMRGEDPDNVTHVDIVRGADVPIPDGAGYVCGGDGAHGSEGFFARLDKDRNLIWIAALTDSNPFEKAEACGRLATFTNKLRQLGDGRSGPSRLRLSPLAHRQRAGEDSLGCWWRHLVPILRICRRQSAAPGLLPA
ncbi:hypothetical protein ONA91_39965 [Micromonospora sp. DR5-3]|uniref:hypothetical protein n=1 Tax=unclassified Micromonospora TaxID=2617518 RepID=UPI0011D83CCC|nr:MULTISPECIES: hypothetical protein [unclassified Micromonospora]MCW3820627.1 hypothetical protein [Micromonospora sp. DR5-3]TYC19080.1 hypothetical protein FXF52_38555 [Micromonospora sp. MP36]